VARHRVACETVRNLRAAAGSGKSVGLAVRGSRIGPIQVSDGGDTTWLAGASNVEGNPAARSIADDPIGVGTALVGQADEPEAQVAIE
jgi:hypothetical protein